MRIRDFWKFGEKNLLEKGDFELRGFVKREIRSFKQKEEFFLQEFSEVGIFC